MASDVDWVAVARRNSRSVQTTVGWIFWDPGAVARYGELGLPGPLGYIAARATPLLAAGPEAVIAAFGSISPGAIRWAYALLDEHGTDPLDVWRARDAAVVEGLHEHAPAAVPALEELGPELWAGRRPAAHRRAGSSSGPTSAMPRPDDPLLSGWHAVNCLREWRGDTHWALVVAAGLTGVEASCLHNAWLGYEPDWLPTSRGSNPDEIAEGWAGLEAKGLARAAPPPPRARPAPAARGRHRPGARPCRGSCWARSARSRSPSCSSRPASCCCAVSTSPPARTTSRRRGCATAGADPAPGRSRGLRPRRSPSRSGR